MKHSRDRSLKGCTCSMYKGEVSHLIECEAGTMISRNVGISIRPGIGIGDNRERDWSLGIGLRVLF